MKRSVCCSGKALALTLMLVMLLSGCETLPGTRPKIDEQTANTLMQQGQFREAALAFRKLARAQRSNRARFQLLSANAWREEGEFSEVEKTLSQIPRDQLQADQTFQMDLLDAEILLQSGDANGALNLLVADPTKLSPELAQRYYELRARAFAAKGDHANSAAERAGLNTLLDPVERAANEFELKAALAKMSPEQSRNLLRATPRNDPLYAFLIALGPQMREGGTQSFTDSVAASPAIKREGSLAKAERAAVQKIAILLPQTGPAAGAAKAIQDGIFSAYFSDVDNKPELLLIDSGTTAQSALAAYRAAQAQGCDFVIGPLQRDQVTAIFQSEQAVLPMLALNFAESSTLPPKGSLQFALLPEEEAVAVAEHMFGRGLKRVSMLVPNDDFGKRSADAFETKFVSLGGEVLERASFSTTSTDHSAALKAALGVGESQARTQLVRNVVGIPFTAQAARRYDLEGIFVAARPEQGRILLPQLRAYDAQDWPIVATSHVYAGSHNRSLDRDLNGIEFCDAPWVLGHSLDSSIPNRSVVGALSSSFGAGGRLFAYGIDAYRLAPYVGWMERNVGTSLPGATGLLSADQNGSIRRKPSWAAMVDGTPQISAVRESGTETQ